MDTRYHLLHVVVEEVAAGRFRHVPSTSKYWCTVPGHRAARMKGAITVE